MNNVPNEALSNTLTILADNGTTVSDSQQEALQLLTGYFDYVSSTRDEVVTRSISPLPCGTGKTTAIRGFCKALAECDEDRTIIVCAEKVEGLCQLKRDMIADGITPDKISLLHSYDHDPLYVPSNPKPNTASEPPTDQNDLRQFVLLTHAKLHKGFHNLEYDLLIYDESLLLGDPSVTDLPELAGEIAKYLAATRATGKTLSADRLILSSWLSGLQNQLQDRSLFQLKLPLSISQVRSHLTKALGNNSPLLPFVSKVHEQLDFALHHSQQGPALISYKPTLPDTMSKMVILDASYPIRKLLHLNRKGSKEIPFSFDPEERYRKVVDYGGVTIHSAKTKAGRTHILNEISKGDNPAVYDETAHLAINKSKEGKKVLVVTYKDGLDTLANLIKDLATDDTAEDIKYLTWGNETAINRHSDCDVVILAGVLTLPHSVVAAKAAAQADKIDLGLNTEELGIAVLTEKTHVAYQALCRGCCRIVQDGKAKTMEAYLFSDDANQLEPLLHEVLPGAQFKSYEGKYIQDNRTKKDRCMVEIIEFFHEQDRRGIGKFSVTALYQALGEEFGKDTKKDALAAAVAHNGYDLELDWDRVERSFVRTPNFDET